MKKILHSLTIITGISCLTAFSGEPNPQEAKPAASSHNISIQIQTNQIGYAPLAHKSAIVPDTKATKFSVINTKTGKTVYSGTLSTAGYWAPAEETFKKADFSSVTQPGNYIIKVAGIKDSYPFAIQTNIYEHVHDAAIKAYYFNRATTELQKTHAGKYARALGHPDTQVKIHESAADKKRPAGTIISAPKGWYDAGDYNKYIVNSGISTYTLLTAYLRSPDFYNNRTWNIPESTDKVPDILNEIMWNLEWMQAMQDPNDGGVYHKLTTKNFSGVQMPHLATEQRYVVAKGTAAALNFTAVMSAAARVYKPYESHYPGKPKAFRKAALKAWKWAQKNNNIPYKNPKDIYTGAYDDTVFDDEFAWAAAELYLLTHKKKFLNRFMQANIDIQTPSWSQLSAFGYIALSQQGSQLLPPKSAKHINDRIIARADNIVQMMQQSPYDMPLKVDDFVWGSTAIVLNRAIIAIEAHRITGKEQYRAAAQSLVDFVMGKNPTGYSFITGFGQKPPMHIHHRPSQADGNSDPIPGWLAGGPHNGHQDDCKYTTSTPAKSYFDGWCSYSTNEIAINWNAPLVYMLSALEESYKNNASIATD